LQLDFLQGSRIPAPHSFGGPCFRHSLETRPFEKLIYRAAHLSAHVPKIEWECRGASPSATLWKSVRTRLTMVAASVLPGGPYRPCFGWQWGGTCVTIWSVQALRGGNGLPTHHRRCGAGGTV